jgi:hypothetical protein
MGPLGVNDPRGPQRLSNMAQIRIVGIDPGQTTGYVEVLCDPDSGEWQIIDAREIAWEDRFILKPLLTCSSVKFIADGPELPVEPLLPAYVVCEQFTLYANKARDQVGSHFPSVRIIGTLEAYLDEYHILGRLMFQGASVRERVQVLPQHESMLGTSDHTHDAYQHVRYFIVTKGWLRNARGN